MSSPFLVELVAPRMYASHRSCDTTAKRDGSERDDKDGTHGITVEKCRYCVYMHSLLRKKARACGSKHHSRVTRIRASPCSASINIFVGPRGCKGGRKFRVRGKRRTDEVKHSHRVFRTLLECVRGATRNGYDLEQGLRRRPGWF